MIFRKKLSIMNALLAIGLVCGCSEDRREYEDNTAYADSKVSPVPLTLLKKEVRSYRAHDVGYLYFATGDQSNKVAFIAQKQLPCPKSNAKFFELQIGDKKLPAEWRKALTHRDEDNCRFGWAAEDRLHHELYWSYVRED